MPEEAREEVPSLLRGTLYYTAHFNAVMGVVATLLGVWATMQLLGPNHALGAAGWLIATLFLFNSTVDSVMDVLEYRRRGVDESV